MAVFVTRKKSRLSKKLRSNELGFLYSFLEKILLRLPAAFFMLVFIYIWCSSTTILSGNIVHLCVSSRKLNNLYCLSAGTQPNFQIPVSPANHTSSKEEAADFGIKSLIPTDNSSSSRIKDEEAADLDSKNSIRILAVNDTSFAEEAADFGIKSLIPTDNSSTSSISGEEAADFGSKNRTISVVNGSSSSEEAAEFGVKNLIHADSSSSSRIRDEEAADFDNKNLILAVNETEEEYAYKVVEGQLKLQRSWISSSNPATCEGRGIYVYELPSKFNKDLTAQCNDIPCVDFCKYLSNDGLGEAIEEDKLGRGWYNTHQYALEPIFHMRVLKHPCRVYDRKEARLLYVPYYGGLDVLRWHFKNVSGDLKDSLAVDLMRWLETQESWYRNLGKDHVFVLGKVSWDFRRNERDSWGTRFLELDEMQNPVKLLIERHPWRLNDVGIPHPTYFHPHTDDDIIKWQLKMSKSSRRNVVSFAGAARPDSPESIRSVLIEQCTSSEVHCRFLNCTSGQCDRPDAIVELFKESEFCLQPPGDSPTRKSVFDSLISGCIPVLFDRMTAYYQYPWHLPEDGEKYSVFIEKEEVRNKSVNVVERLIKIPERERENMRRYIVYELLPGLVYGDLDSKFDKFQDAFSITVNSLLERVSRFNNV